MLSKKYKNLIAFYMDACLFMESVGLSIGLVLFILISIWKTRIFPFCENMGRYLILAAVIKFSRLETNIRAVGGVTIALSRVGLNEWKIYASMLHI